MTKQEFGQFVMALKSFYSKENILMNEASIELWYDQLKDIPYNVASTFLSKWVSTERWAPAICDIRAGATEMIDGVMQDWGAGWAQVETAIRKYGMYQEAEALASMDAITRETCKRLGFRNICTSENITADRANFRMIYEQIANRKKIDRQIAPDARLAMAKLQEEISEKRQLFIE